MLVPFYTNVTTQVASGLNIPPGYRIKARGYRSIINSATEKLGATTGYFVIAPVGVHEGSYYKLFDLWVAFNRAIGSVFFYYAYAHGKPSDTPGWYMSPGQDINYLFASMPLAVLTDDHELVMEIVGRRIKYEIAGSTLISTLFKDPITLDSLYTVAYLYVDGTLLPAGSLIGVVDVTVEQVADLTIMLPVVIAVGVASAVVASIVSMLARLFK
jgi:hypothetical protein